MAIWRWLTTRINEEGFGGRVREERKGGRMDEGLDVMRRTKGGEVTHQQVRAGGTEGGEWVVGGFLGGIIC